MSLHAAQLLKRLEPAIRPGSSPIPPTQPRGTIESQSFEQLLSLASQGAMPSGRQVDVAIDLNPPLDASQLERLAAAADQAEASGSTRALMLMDGRAFVVDLQSRSLVAELSASSQTSIQNVDAAIVVPGDEISTPGTMSGPGAGVIPSAALQQILNANSSKASPLP